MSNMKLIFFLSILRLILTKDIISSYVFSDCKHLILPVRCQCYHSGHESQLRCLRSELHSLPKLPNNMRWIALDFSYNYITSVDNYVFADIYVERINLRSNYLRRIEVTAFNHIKNLKELYIDSNQLKEFYPETLLSPGESLEVLDLSHNPLQYLDIGKVLLNLPVLKRLNLMSCYLNNTSIYTLKRLIESTTNEYNQTVSRYGHANLEILNLSHNNLTSICYGLFDGLTNLIELHLNHNLIRLIDNNFLRSFTQIRILNLAHNLIESVPRLSSHSLEILNFSSNHIHYLSEYFASNLHSISFIDFDNNTHLNNTSSRAFCYLNIITLDKMTFRSNNLLSLNTFAELLCRLKNTTTRTHLIDINHNVNLKCNCTLIEFQNYLSDYHDLTCTQQGQDRYYISNLRHWTTNCHEVFCLEQEQYLKTYSCNWADAQRQSYEGTCETKLFLSQERKKHKLKLTSTSTSTLSIDPKYMSNVTEQYNITYTDNSTRIYIKNQSISRTYTCLLSYYFSILIFLSWSMNID